ncbi:MAG: hypothetical protein Q9173_004118, partial [Seirophora scorigena]
AGGEIVFDTKFCVDGHRCDLDKVVLDHQAPKRFVSRILMWQQSVKNGTAVELVEQDAKDALLSVTMRKSSPDEDVSPDDDLKYQKAIRDAELEAEELTRKIADLKKELDTQENIDDNTAGPSEFVPVDGNDDAPSTMGPSNFEPTEDVPNSPSLEGDYAPSPDGSGSVTFPTFQAHQLLPVSRLRHLQILVLLVLLALLVLVLLRTLLSRLRSVWLPAQARRLPRWELASGINGYRRNWRLLDWKAVNKESLTPFAIPADDNELNFLDEGSNAERDTFEEAISRWARDQHIFAAARETPWVALWRDDFAVNDEWHAVDDILKMPEGPEKEVRVAWAKEESPLYFAACLDDEDCFEQSLATDAAAVACPNPMP